MKQEIVIVASGDLRLSANQTTWAAQEEAERAVRRALTGLGATVRRGHEFDPIEGHGFIKSQKHGMEVFRGIPQDAPLVVVEAVWQYSHHVLAGLLTHRGPILTVANWSGQWPGLVGLLNLNASLTKAGVKYSTLWSSDFRDDFFLNGLKEWIDGKPVCHDASHVHPLPSFALPHEAEELADRVARGFLEDKAILGVFDEGCMGMYNAIVPDELLHKTGIFKERLSQSSLYYAAMQVSDGEAASVRSWLDRSGMRFHTGPDEFTDLTDNQILAQCKVYIAALRIAAEFGCDAIGIQYQQGLKDLLPASDLVEGLLNNADRPPVCDLKTGEELFAGCPLPHFNEADECAGVDALVTNRLWSLLGFDPETTLHDIRYGEDYSVNAKKEFVWIFEISGAVPPQHLLGGYRGALCERQPAAFFRLGGATIKGVSKPGPVVWSRIYIEGNRLKADLGRARTISLPDAETERRWKMTTWQWPIMHAVLCGVTRDQMMGRHKSNHIQVAYTPTEDGANLALAAKAATLRNMGFEVSICGSDHGLEASFETRDQAMLVSS